MTLEDLYSRLDLEKVSATYKTYVQSDADETAIRELINAACRRWLLVDWQDFEDGCTILVEQEVQDHNLQLKAFLDIIKIYPEQKAAGTEITRPEITVIDWKTTPGLLNKDWELRQQLSWQWRIYSALVGANGFEYRGVKENYTRDLSITVPEWNTELCVNFVSSEVQRIKDYIAEERLYWPMAWPKPCNAGKREQECEFLRDCTGFSFPREIPQFRPMSYSRFQSLMLCPEKCRRELLLAQDRVEDTGGSDFLRRGKAFHLGIAEIYGQLFIK